MSTQPIRWGILGPGNIANPFAEALNSLPDADLAAVGSRTREKADAFADKHHIARRHVGYEALAADPDLDIIYVATPHAMHAECIQLCLEHGKAVLCEKPFTINTAQAAAVITLARAKGLFLMEAMWTRFFPLMARVRELVRDGAIGDLIMVQADFGFRAGFNPESRLFNPALGGGALLDVGVYPISFASMLLGKPDRIAALTHLGQSGVDEVSGMLLSYSSGALSLLATAVRANTAQDATLIGSEGRIRIHTPWWKPEAMTLTAGGKEERLEVPYQGNGFTHEAIEAMACLRAGKTESDILPLDETLAVMRTMDAIRAQWGLTYPMEP